MTAEIHRPDPSEYAAFYAGYVDQVPEGDIVALLEHQMVATAVLLADLTEAQGDHRYGPEKWSVKELVSHLSDAERVFSYRVLRFARGDTTALPGFDQDPWAASSGCDRRTLVDVAEELRSVRTATLTLVRSLDAAAIGRGGIASGYPVTVRALIYIIAGHERHHLRVLRERYLS
ncbi:MAG TPA: DinB family protein [Gemmatimonadales bacterium]|nr:DinB family protein [Gemmatimonadales bacterium]